MELTSANNQASFGKMAVRRKLYIFFLITFIQINISIQALGTTDVPLLENISAFLHNVFETSRCAGCLKEAYLSFIHKELYRYNNCTPWMCPRHCWKILQHFYTQYLGHISRYTDCSTGVHYQVTDSWPLTASQTRLIP